MSTATAARSTALVVAGQIMTPAIFDSAETVEDILARLEREVRSVKTDISTKEGREAIASLAYKVARSKTALDDMGKELVADWKTKANGVDAERRRIRERLDALKDEVRQPLTDWENAERDRVTAHEEGIRSIEAWSYAGTAATIALRRDELASFYTSRGWQEFAARAAAAFEAMDLRIAGAHAAAVQSEADRAELERLRQEQAEREARERDERIAAEAAARARQEAEAAAEQERARAEQQRQQEARAEEAERQRIEFARQDAEDRAAQAERDRLEAVERADRQEREAQEREQRARDEAAQAERDRIAQEEREATAEQERRDNNTRIRKRVNNAAVVALVKVAGIDVEQAKAVVVAIAKGDVPAVSIRY